MAFGKTDTTIHVTAPNLQILQITVVGTAPYVQNKFSAKAREQMATKQAAGSTAKARKGAHAARDFEADYAAACHRAANGRYGIPAPAFRAALIDSCRLTGLTMARTKLAIFVIADDVDADDATPLVYIDGTPERTDLCVRNSTGVADIRVRPMWRQWSATLKLQYDADVLTQEDVGNLLLRAGAQVGIGEGRPNSKMGYGCGWGTFSI